MSLADTTVEFLNLNKGFLHLQYHLYYFPIIFIKNMYGGIVFLLVFLCIIFVLSYRIVFQNCNQKERTLRKNMTTFEPKKNQLLSGTLKLLKLFNGSSFYFINKKNYFIRIFLYIDFLKKIHLYVTKV